MKRLVVACIALLLVSCIQVDDFGDYWDKATVDPSLVGRWNRVSDANEAKTTGDSWTFTVKNGAYEVQTYVKGKPDDDGPIAPVKSLTVGPYMFLAKGPEQGTILRYKVSGDTVTFYVLDPEAAWAYIQKNFPGESSFYRGDPEDDPNDPENIGDPVKIKTFNDETAKILSSIPDTDHYWDPDTRVRKAK
jgi:hypothetical protein